MSSNTYPLSGNTLNPDGRSSISSSLTNVIIDSDTGHSSFLLVNNSNNSLYIDKYSNISVNHTSPLSQFDINSANGACLTLRYNGTSNLANLYMNNTGKLSINASGGEINTTSDLVMTSTTESTSISTGALRVSGGIGVSKNVYIGGNLMVSGTTNITASMGNDLNENVLITNSAATTVGNDGGIMIKRYQVSNNSGTGDIVNDTPKYSTTIDSATTDTVVLASGASAINDYYKNWWIKITSGAASNDVRKVLSYNGTTRTITVDSVFSAVGSSSDSINLYNKVFPVVAWQESTKQFITAYTSSETDTLSIIDYSDLNAKSLIANSSVMIGSTSLVEGDIAHLTSITDGTVSAGKAVVVDSNKDISSFRNLTATGTITTEGFALTGASMNLSNATTINNSCIWTSGEQPTNTNGIGIRFIGMSATGLIRSYNYVMSQYNNIAINDTAIYVKNDGTVAIGHASPSYALDVGASTTGINTPSIRFGGTLFDHASFLGITAGTVTASKALVVDASRNISTLGNITSNGILTLSNTTDSSSTITGSTIISGGVGIAKNLYIGGNLNIASAKTLTIGSTTLSETEIGFIDGVTAGSAAASKALVLDASKNISTIGNITSNGIITFSNNTGSSSPTTGAVKIAGGVGIAGTLNVGGNIDIDTGGNFIIGSVILADTDLAKIDGIINGTASASKALVVDVLRDIDNIGSIGSTGVFTTSNITDSSSKTTGSIVTAGGIGIALNAYIGGNLNIATTKTLTMGTIVIDETDIGFIDGITAGTVSASKAIVVSAGRSITNMGSITSTGVLSTSNITDATTTATGSIITAGGVGIAKNLYVGGDLNVATTKTITIGSTSLSETDIGFIDGITAGTVVASKAVVVDASRNISTLGNITSDGVLTTTNATDSTTTATGSIITSGGVGIAKSVFIGGDLNIATTKTLTIGSTVLSETEIGFIDGLTAGTISASKAVVVDASRNISTLGNITSDGVLTLSNTTDSTSTITGSTIISGGVGIAKNVFIGGDLNIATTKTLTIGSTIIDETDIAKIDGITNGTVSASKAVVVDASRNISTLGNITSDGVLTLSNTTDSSSTITGSTIISGGVGIAKNLSVGTGINIGSTQIVDSSRNAAFNTITTTTEVYGTNNTRVATTAFVETAITTRTAAMFAPTGIENIADSVVTYDSSTRVVTISPTGASFVVWIGGIRFVISSPQSTAAHSTTAGVVYYIFFDNVPSLQVSTSFPSYYSKAMVAVVYYYDATHYMLNEERHGTVMDPATHTELHFNIGTYYVNGLALSGYSTAPSSPVDTNNTFAIAQGVISDEQLNSTITAVADNGPYTVFSMSGATGLWSWTTGNTVPYAFAAGSYIQYNQWTGTTWQLTALTNNSYVCYYIMFVPSKNTETQVLLIPGQSSYSTLTAAQAESFFSMTLATFLLPEFLPLYQIIFKTGSSYGTSGKCRIEQVNRIVGTRTTIQNNTASNHQALSGLQLATTGVTYGHIDDQPQTIAGVKTFSNTTDSTSTTTGSLITSGGLGVALNTYIGGNVNIASTKTLTIGSTSLSEAEIGFVDGVTAGTVSASKAVVVDSSRNISTLGNITSDGVLTTTNATDSTTTATGSIITSGGAGIAKSVFIGGNLNIATTKTLTIGSTTIDETDIAKIDSITNGTAAASKALILDSSRNITNINQVSSTGKISVSFLNDTATYITYQEWINSLGTPINMRAEMTNVGGRIATTSNHPMRIGANNINRIYIDASGNTSIGTAATAQSTYGLEVQGTLNCTSTATFSTITSSGIVSTTNATDATTTATGSIITSGGVGIAKNLYIGGNVNIATTKTLTIGSTSLTEAEIGFVDAVTAGTAAASKAVVLDASRNISTLGNITSDGVLTLSNVTDSSSTITGAVKISGGVGIAKKLFIGDNVSIATTKTLTIGSTIIDETDMAKIDGITNGTVAASKAVVVDASRNISTLGNITSDGVLTISNVTDSSSTITGSVTISGGVGVAKNLYVGGNLNVATTKTITIGSTSLSETEIGFIDGITAGTAAASKAVVLDSSSNIATINTLTATDLKSTSAEISGNLRVGATSAASFPIHLGVAAADKIISVFNTGTTDDFYGFGANGSHLLTQAATGHKWYCSSLGNSLGTQIMTANTTSLSILQTTDASSYSTGALIVSGGMSVAKKAYIAGPIMVGDSTDTARMISALKSTMATNDIIYYTLGQANSAKNQAEIAFKYAGAASDSNQIFLGFHSNPVLYITANKRVHIGDIGAQKFNILDSITSPSMRMGRAESTNNSMTLRWSHVGDGNGGNGIAFDSYGTSDQFYIGKDFCACGGTPQGSRGRFQIYNGIGFTYSGTLNYYNIAANVASSTTSSPQNCGLYCDANGYFNSWIMCLSDKRVKTNIQDIDISDEMFMKFKPSRYNKDNNPKAEIGLIAQDVYKMGLLDILDLMPDEKMKKTCDEDPEDGWRWAMQYDKVGVLCIPVIKRLITRNNTLEMEISNQAQQLQDQQAQLDVQAAEITELKRMMNELLNK